MMLALRLVAPGTQLREGLDRILQARMGALIVVGDGPDVLSVCSGGFLLAALRLFDGHRIATHWDSCKPFTETFPSVKVDPDALYVVDGRLWTSAGVTSGIDSVSTYPRIAESGVINSCDTSASS